MEEWEKAKPEHRKNQKRFGAKHKLKNENFLFFHLHVYYYRVLLFSYL